MMAHLLLIIMVALNINMVIFIYTHILKMFSTIVNIFVMMSTTKFIFFLLLQLALKTIIDRLSYTGLQKGSSYKNFKWKRGAFIGILEKFQTLIILLAVGSGILLGQIGVIERYAETLVVPFLFLMLYGLFLTIPLHQLKKAFLNIRFLGSSTIINFIWTPVLAWGLGAIFLSDHPALWIGFIMLMVTPCTDWYLAFTGIAKGNVSLSTSILPINLILQVVLLPIYLLLFAGSIETIPLPTLIESILIVLIFPFVLAHLTRFLLRRKEPVLSNIVIPFFSNAQIFFLSFAIMAMFASQGSYLLDHLEVIYILIIPILIFLLSTMC